MSQQQAEHQEPDDGLFIRSSQHRRQQPDNRENGNSSDGEIDAPVSDSYPPKTTRNGSPRRGSEAAANTDHDAGSGADASKKAAKTSSARAKAARPTVDLLKKYAVPVWILPHIKRPRSWAIVLRCAVAQWAGLMLMLVGPSERLMGQASFLLLVVALILPPYQPLAPSLVQYALAIFQVGLAWAYSCFAIRMAWMARQTFKFASQADFGAFIVPRFQSEGIPLDRYSVEIQRTIFTGEFIETRSSVTLAVLYGVYCGLILWFRGWLGPSPYVFGIILSIIMTSICLLYSPFFPYPYYMLGWTFFLPFISQLAINIVCCFLIFPESLHHQFLERLIGVIEPLRTILKDQEDMLSCDPGSDEWSAFDRHRGLLGQATKGLGLLGVTETLVKQNITLQRATGGDLKALLRDVRLLSFRASGFVYFNTTLQRQFAERGQEPTVDDLIIHVNPSRPASRAPSPDASSEDHEDNGHSLHHESSSSLHADDNHPHHRHEKGLLHAVFKPFDINIFHHSGGRSPKNTSPLPSRSSSRQRLHDVQPVGLDESQRYMRLEEALKSADLSYFPHLIESLRVTSLTLLHETDSMLEHVTTCFKRMKNTTIFQVFQESEKAWGLDIQKNEEVVQRFRDAIAAYEQDDRLPVVREFDPLFESQAMSGLRLPGIIQPSHRLLFWAYTYQWTLIQYSKAVLSLADHITDIEAKRRRQTLQFPQRKSTLRFLQSFSDEKEMTDSGPEEADYLANRENPYLRNPDFVHGSRSTTTSKLGSLIWHIGHFTTRQDVLFGLKAGIFSVLGAFPAFFKGSASFFYYNRGLWVTIMVALTLSQYVGDTIFAWVIRVIATSAGALVGMVIWYIGNGGGHNAYGTAAVCAVAFPLLQAFRIFHPNPLQGILTTVTTALVLGYSWQDETNTPLANPGSGWGVAWRRWLLVMIGITVAFLAAFLPPKSTQKKAVRALYANALYSSGELLFRLAEISHSKDGPIEHPPRFMKDVTALKGKLVRSAVARDKIRFEISLRGVWPVQEYEKLASLLIETIDYITQLANILFSLDVVWTKAVLRRTRLDDPDFLSSVSGAILLCGNALRTGSPLPYYHPPLVEEFIKRRYSSAISMDAFESALPKEVDADLLSSMDYLKFSCAISITYSIINRLDRIFFVIKRLVGEDFYIKGLQTYSDDDRQALLASHQRDGEAV